MMEINEAHENNNDVVDVKPCLSIVNSHISWCLTTKCHPYLPIIGSGSIDGSVNFYQPSL